MVLMPPGSAKSMYASTLFPAWWFCDHPESAVIAASHTAELAERFGRKARNMVAQNAPVLGYNLTEDSRAAGRWETTTGGEYFAAGVGGAVTGRRADLCIIDDPVKSQEHAESEVIRDWTWEWYKSDLYTRLKPGARIILIMTRWHLDDLGGRLLADMANGGDQWTVLKLPAFAVDVNDPLGRKIGEPLWPEWEDAEALARKRTTLGVRQFGALFQQDPQPPGGSFFDVANVLVDGEPVDYPLHPDAVFAVVDTATKTGSRHDGTAVSFYAVTQGRGIPLICLDWSVDQIEGALLETWLPTIFQRLEELAKATKARMGSIGAYVEDKSSGMVLLQQGARRGWPTVAIDSALTSVGKDERAISVSGYVHSGMVKMSRHAYEKTTDYKGRHANHFLKQVFGFRLGVKDQEDDALDSFCYAIAISLGDSQGF